MTWQIAVDLWYPGGKARFHVALLRRMLWTVSDGEKVVLSSQSPLLLPKTQAVSLGHLPNAYSPWNARHWICNPLLPSYHYSGKSLGQDKRSALFSCRSGRCWLVFKGSVTSCHSSERMDLHHLSWRVKICPEKQYVWMKFLPLPETSGSPGLFLS